MRYFGALCKIHPEQNGERYKVNNCCIACNNANSVKRRKIKYNTNLEYRQQRNILDNTRTGQRRDSMYIPLWANRKAIDEIITKIHAEGKVVDHIVPINGEMVCGFHVENNLQGLTALENSIKGNKYVDC